MDLARTPEQEQIAAAVRRFAVDRIDVARLRMWESTAAGIDEETWQQIASLGWLGIGASASAGGLDLGLPEIAAWFEEAARSLVPLPVMHAVRAIRCLARLDPAAAELPELVAGRKLVAANVPRFAESEAPELRLEGSAGRERLAGEVSFLSNGARADWHLLLAWQADGPAFVLVEKREGDLQELRTFDGDRQVRVRYASVPVCRVLVHGSAARDLWRQLWQEQQALAFAEIAGVMDAALDRTVQYVKQREQFGQKIGAFQAVQHQVADMAIALTAGRHLAWQAITRLAAGSLEGWELAAAAAFLGPAGKRLTLTAHHLHGGAGYVLDHPLHYYSERALALSIRYVGEEEALATMAHWWLDREAANS